MTTYPGNAEARALSAALNAAGGWTPCDGMEPEQIDPSTCDGCRVRVECLAYGRVAGTAGVFGGVRFENPKPRRNRV